ncbi:MAG: hypothetical protein D6748_04300 [Calditrichaeota bacterium]|nr:MAG: hypothetical protein D6748_04300 [Calditrichota bacterium]
MFFNQRPGQLLTIFLFSFMFFLFLFCQEREMEPIEDFQRIPPTTAKDSLFTGVFSPLDGTWKGKFYIYQDTLGQRSTPSPPPRQLDSAYFQQLPLKLVQTIQVQQNYVSLTPYFQRVIIRDEYLDADGNKKVVESQGANKIQKGKLWCVVKKPDELVVHRGTLLDSGVYIWQREQSSPLKKEFFYEVVQGNLYQIWGWGYYDEDNPLLSPRWWFHGRYTRK